MHLMDCQRGCGGTWAKIRRADRVVGVCRSTPDNDKEFRNLIRVDSACFSNVEVAVRRPPLQSDLGLHHHDPSSRWLQSRNQGPDCVLAPVRRYPRRSIWPAKDLDFVRLQVSMTERADILTGCRPRPLSAIAYLVSGPNDLARLTQWVL